MEENYDDDFDSPPVKQHGVKITSTKTATTTAGTKKL